MAENTKSQITTTIKASITANIQEIVKGSSKAAKDYMIISLCIALLMIVSFIGELMTRRIILTPFIINIGFLFFIGFGIVIVISRFMEEKERIKSVAR